MDHSSYSLINAVLSKKPFRHPNQEVLKGDYEFIRFNHNDRTVSLDNCKTGKRIEVCEGVFEAMRTHITDDYLEMLFHGANYKKPAQNKPKHTKVGITVSKPYGHGQVLFPRPYYNL